MSERSDIPAEQACGATLPAEGLITPCTAPYSRDGEHTCVAAADPHYEHPCGCGSYFTTPEGQAGYARGVQAGREAAARLDSMIERAIESADWEPGDAQRALRELRDDYARLARGTHQEGEETCPSCDHPVPEHGDDDSGPYNVCPARRTHQEGRDSLP